MVGKVFTEHRATFAQLDMKKTLKVVGRFIHNDAVGMKRIFAKAEAKKEAGEAVARAIQSLTAMAVFPSPSLHFFRSIIAEVRVPPAELANRRKDTQLIMDVHNHVDPEKAFTVWNSKASPEIDEVGADTQARLGDPLFRVALLDAAWKESAGKGKLGILLKNREGGARDGTRALKSDLRKLAETGSWDKLQKAASLAHALDKVKTAQGSEADKKQWLIAIARGVHHEFGIALPEQLDSAAVSDWIGKALTALLHPEFQSAEVHSAEGSDNRQMDSRDVLRLFESFFELLASDKISPVKVTESFYKCYELGLTIAALIFGNKKSFTEKDIALLKGFLKSPPITPEAEMNEAAVERWQNLDTALDKIDLRASSTEVLLQMSRVYARHCIEGNVQVLMSPETMSQGDYELEGAKNADDVIKLLKAAFDGAFERTGMDSIAFSLLLMDVANSGLT